MLMWHYWGYVIISENFNIYFNYFLKNYFKNYFFILLYLQCGGGSGGENQMLMALCKLQIFPNNSSQVIFQSSKDNLPKMKFND